MSLEEIEAKLKKSKFYLSAIFPKFQTDLFTQNPFHLLIAIIFDWPSLIRSTWKCNRYRSYWCLEKIGNLECKIEFYAQHVEQI